MNIVQLLLYYGADTHITNTRGRTAVDVADRNNQYKIVAIMEQCVGEQLVTIPARIMNPDEFASLMGSAYQGRKWRIEKTEAHKITASYVKSGRVFKVTASMQGSNIRLQFLRGYGARSTNYLKNLETDLLNKL